MPPTSRAPDDALDLDALDMKASGKKPTASESDFEKELEALFAEELAAADETPASAPPVGGPAPDPAVAPASAPVSEPEDELLELSLGDLVEDASADGDDDILDLSAFAEGAGSDLLSPPEDVSGGKDGGIDLAGLDDLISGLGEKAAAPAQPAAPEPLDSTDMADLLETLDVPAAGQTAAVSAAQPVEPAEPAEDLLELSLGDLVEESAAATPEAEVAEHPDAAVADDDLLGLTLPDLSDPEPGRDLAPEQEPADLGGDLNLSLPDLDESAEAVAPAGLETILDSGDLDMSGLMEGIESSAGEPEPERSLDPQALLDELAAPGTAPVAGLEVEPEAAPEVEPEAELEVAPEAELAPAAFAAPEAEPLAEASESALEEPALEEPMLEEPVLPLADAALGVVAAGAAFAASESPAAPAALSGEALAAIEQRLAELALQVTGSSVAVVRLEGQLAERERALSDLEARLHASQEEAGALREELTALRSQLEAGLESRLAEADREANAAREEARAASDAAQALGARVEGAEKAVAGAAERLAVVEDRQAQLDREIFSEISRAVPREAARVIREEIAALAASMRDE